MSTANPFFCAPSNPIHQIAVLLVDYLVATGVLKDAEALRREGEARERTRQRNKTKKKKSKASAASKKRRKPQPKKKAKAKR